MGLVTPQGTDVDQSVFRVAEVLPLPDENLTDLTGVEAREM